MKKILILTLKPTLFIALFLIGGAVTAQEMIDDDFIERLENNAKPIWQEESGTFNSNTTPVKWNNESAVVMGYKRSILFDKQSRGGFFTARQSNVFFFEKVHFKIKLQDKNSVEAFTEVYFRYAKKEDAFSAHIIKPDGTIQNIDLKNAVGVEFKSDVPEFFKSFFDQNYSNSDGTIYYKVAVPGMEPGDILEYVSNTKSGYNVTYAGQWVQFEPQYEICSKKYPVMYNEIDIETDNYTYFKSLSLNGAPEFKKESTKEADFYRYVFIDKDRATETDVNFVNPYMVYPLVKFQVTFARNEQAKGLLIGEKGELKSSFTKEELARKAWDSYKQTGNWRYSYLTTVQRAISESWSELNKLGAKNWTEQEYINKCYYYLRYKQMMDGNYLNDRAFAYFFGSLLYQRDIASELVISISNRIGTLDEVLFDDEICYAVKVKDKIYFNNTNFSNPEDLLAYLLNNDAYIISESSPKAKTLDIKSLKLPDATAADNTASYSLDVQLNAAMNNLVVSRTSNYTGLSKATNSPKALKYVNNLIRDDYKLYDGTAPTEKLKSTELDAYLKLEKQITDENKVAKKDYQEDQLQSEYNQKVIFKDFKVLSAGRTLKKPILSYTENFELGDNVKRAGKNYLINITGLVGSQLQIKPKERDRKLDINMDYARTLTWNISFKIPDGYTVDGFKELNNKTENEVGEYSCNATEENGFVKINITKTYKQYKIGKEKWKDVLAFVDAAYNNSFKYILLKPKS